MMIRYVTLVLGENNSKNFFKLKNCVGTTQPLEMLHMDLCGPMRITSRGGKRYVLILVDDYSRFTWTLFLASNDETFEKFVTFIKKVEKRVGHSLVSLSQIMVLNLKIQVLLTIVMNMVLNTTFQFQEHPSRMGWSSAKTGP